MSAKIGLLTCESLPELCDDESPFVEALAKYGYRTYPMIWSDDQWQECDYLVFRNTWDYIHRYTEFTDFLNRLQTSRTTVFNDLDLVRSNINKTYLLNLQDQAFPVVPTKLLRSDELEGYFLPSDTNFHWENYVLKPSVSADSHCTFRGSLDLVLKQACSIQLERGSQWLLQPFLPSIVEEGEISLMYFDGQRSHSVLKKVKAGDFRVQDTYGGTAELIEADPKIWKTGDQILQSLPSTPLYARVDLINFRGKPHLLELELIEPSLFFKKASGSASRFAGAIHRRIQSGKT